MEEFPEDGWLLRRINPDWIEPDLDAPHGWRPKSQAFQDMEQAGVRAMSVHDESRLLAIGREVTDLLDGFVGYGLVALRVSDVRSLGYTIAMAPDPNDTRCGAAHAHVFGDFKKGNSRALKRLSVVRVSP